MRQVLSLALAAAAAITILGCGETEEALQSGTPLPSTAPEATPSPTADATQVPSPTPAPSRTSTSISTPSLDWPSYTDPQSGLTIRRPSELPPEEHHIQFPAKDGLPAVDVRILVFTTEKGAFAESVTIAPNPAGLSLQEWIETYPGWPGEPTHISVAGESALLFPIDQLGEPVPQIFFDHGDAIYTIEANVNGRMGQPPAMTEIQFNEMLNLVDFSQ